MKTLWITMPVEGYRKDDHEDWLRRAVRIALKMYAGYALGTALDPTKADVIVDVQVYWKDPSFNRGRGFFEDRDGKRYGTVMLNMDRVEYPWFLRAILGPIALENLLAHEVGHVLGLSHCERADCVMTKPEIAGYPQVIWAWLQKGTRLCGIHKREVGKFAGEEK